MTADTSFAPGVLAKASDIGLVIFDVDGVLTDGRLYYADDGTEYKAFHARDGASIKLLLESGIHVALVSGRESATVTRRARELGITFIYQSAGDKLSALEDLCSRSRLAPARMAHVGDDLPDLELLARVGLPVAVADAHPTVRKLAAYTTQLPGGRGAASEVCQLVLTAQNKWPYAQR